MIDRMGETLHAAYMHRRCTASGVNVTTQQSLDVSAVSTALFSTNHSTYAESKELLSDISALMLEGKHPPSFRNGKFKAQGEGQRVYWRYAE